MCVGCVGGAKQHGLHDAVLLLLCFGTTGATCLSGAAERTGLFMEDCTALKRGRLHLLPCDQVLCIRVLYIYSCEWFCWSMLACCCIAA